MENADTRNYRHTLDPAVREYREAVNANPDNEKDIARDVAEKHNVTQKDLRDRAKAGA